jgi:hyperosmotically inducible protein
MKTKLTPLLLAASLGLTGATAILVSGCAGDKYSRSTGEYIDDKTVISRVNSALHDNAEYKFESVQVASFKGNVQLSGFVDSEAQKYNAAKIAKTVQGVRDVENDITVGNSTSTTTGQYIDDKSLTHRVNNALGDNQEYKFNEVNVTCQQGTAQLSGFVNTKDQKSQAGDIAKNVPGVKDVVNNISVKDSLNQ